MKTTNDVRAMVIAAMERLSKEHTNRSWRVSSVVSEIRWNEDKGKKTEVKDGAVRKVLRALVDEKVLRKTRYGNAEAFRFPTKWDLSLEEARAISERNAERVAKFLLSLGFTAERIKEDFRDGRGWAFSSHELVEVLKAANPSAVDLDRELEDYPSDDE